jgi:uncharacterized membrane protein
MKAVVLALALAACGDTPVTIDEMPCPETGTALTYDGFGKIFLASRCNTCHTTSKSGAPGKYKFDTVEDVRRLADRIFVRAAGPNVTMPPGPDDPPATERDQLAEWLACGAP